MNQPTLTFPSAPIEDETLAVVDMVGRDWLADDDWCRFRDACYNAGRTTGVVDPGRVRAYLTNSHGDLVMSPRRLSAFYNRAAGKAGFLDFSHWAISDDKKGRNQGRPCRHYRLRP